MGVCVAIFDEDFIVNIFLNIYKFYFCMKYITHLYIRLFYFICHNFC